MIIEPKIRGFICTTAHPDGCAVHVQKQIDFVKSHPVLENAPKRVLVIGASTGYGLASRIVAAFGGKASTLGVFFERAGTEKKPASAGWYHTAAFEVAAAKEGLYAKSFNGDAFSNEMKEEVIATIKKDLGEVDLVIYSLASPRRLDPATGQTYKSVLKPTKSTFTNKNINTDKKEIDLVSIEPATEEEIANTVKVMGGEDWKLWIEGLAASGALAKDFRTIAYSYIGPQITWAIYTDGTIGHAKLDLEKTARQLDEQFGAGTALISVNKALVTQASSAIPVVPLYISILYKVMKSKNLHEGCIQQMYRLFAEHLTQKPKLDAKGRIRIDDWEMREDVQAEVAQIWKEITTETIDQISDFAGYQKEFYHLFGFDFPEINYHRETDPIRPIPSLSLQDQ
ncbi:MAG: bifunctional NADH-specific enoyl-ACP reductase/trans-2-enoyl-CoA reductase [Verrucomicrobia bacterium]|nr:MAG: bifunctional NADH-specific enoyl-ACP reductase/trans-2-enoyl-CoA reductase [Verrucomicrobiota bacterium]